MGDTAKMNMNDAQCLIDSLPDRRTTLAERVHRRDARQADMVEYAIDRIDCALAQGKSLTAEESLQYELVKQWLATRRDCDLSRAANQLQRNLRLVYESTVMSALSWIIALAGQLEVEADRSEQRMLFRYVLDDITKLEQEHSRG